MAKTEVTKKTPRKAAPAKGIDLKVFSVMGDEVGTTTVPEGILGVFQLARGEGNVAYVGRADQDLRASLLSLLEKGYTHFQWVQAPWTKETYEMQCRLYHFAGGNKRLDNEDHPYPPEGKNWACRISGKPAALCDL
jgi:hypothetical protein